MTKEFGRRDFLKMVGVTSAVGAGAVAASTVAPKAAKAGYTENPHSWGVRIAIKELDKPSYMYPPYSDADKLPKYDANRIPQMNSRLYITPEFREKYKDETQRKMKAGVPGFTLRDQAFASAASGSNYNDILMDWRPDAKTPKTVEMYGKWEDTPENNALAVKKAAHFFGSGATGICEINRQWVYSRYGNPIEWVDVSEEVPHPMKTEDVTYLTNNLKYAVVMLIPQDGEIGKSCPSKLSEAMDNYGYSCQTETISKVARFIRGLGYDAIPLHNDTAMSIPLAIDAGLGELGRHGLLINPELGSNMRVCKVFTSLPLACDKPISFGAAEFCKTCMKCAKVCPSQSISKEPLPTGEAQAPSNNAGMIKWYTNGYGCFQLWTSNGASCNSCQRVCTYSKPQTWVHDMIKVTTSKTKLFNSIFAKMDDAFGYGKNIDDYTAEEVDEWWTSPDTRNYNWRYFGNNL